MNFDELWNERERVLSEATLDMLLSSLALIMVEWRDDEMTNNVRLIHAWLCEEIEKRVPEITPLLDKHAKDLVNLRYGQMVMLAVETVRRFC